MAYLTPATGKRAQRAATDAASAAGLRLPLFVEQGGRDPRGNTVSFVTSLTVHALVIALLLWGGATGVLTTASSQGVGTGIGAGLAGGGGGGSTGDEQLTYFELPPAPPAPEETPAAPVIEAPPELPPVEAPLIVPDASATTGATTPTGNSTGIGTGQGPGTGPGTGPGSGGGSGGGEGGGIGSGVGKGTGKGNIMAPSPNLILIPPTAPGNVKGRTVTVRLEVDATGKVTSAEIIPSTGNRGYDDKLRKAALGWKFRPARDASNHPVAALFEVEFTF